MTVKILKVRGRKVRLGIQAPESTKILREELREFPREPAMDESVSSASS